MLIRTKSSRWFLLFATLSLPTAYADVLIETPQRGIAVEQKLLADDDVFFETPEHALLQHGIPIEPQALSDALLSRPEPGLRQAAAIVIGKRRFTAAIPALRKALDDSWSGVGVCAAGSLLLMKDSTGLPLLERALRDKNPYIIAEAAKELVAANDPRAFERLTARLEIPGNDGRIVLVEALAQHSRFKQLKDDVRKALIHILLDDPLADARLVAAQELYKDPDPAVLAAFQAANAKETDKVVRGVVLTYLQTVAKTKDKR